MDVGQIPQSFDAIYREAGLPALQAPSQSERRAATRNRRTLTRIPIWEPELGTVVALRGAAASTAATSGVIRAGMEFSGGTGVFTTATSGGRRRSN